MFEWECRREALGRHASPFTAPKNDAPAALRAAPGEALAKAYDMVLNGSEIGGGLGAHSPPGHAVDGV